MSWEEIREMPPGNRSKAGFWVSCGLRPVGRNVGQRLVIYVSSDLVAALGWKSGCWLKVLAGTDGDEGKLRISGAEAGFLLRRTGRTSSACCMLAVPRVPGVKAANVRAVSAQFSHDGKELRVTIPAACRVAPSCGPVSTKPVSKPIYIANPPAVVNARTADEATIEAHAAAMRSAGHSRTDLIEQVQPENAGSRRQALGELRFRDDPRADSDRYPIYGSAPPERKTLP